jgi:tRNA pseudouridine synthase 10
VGLAEDVDDILEAARAIDWTRLGERALDDACLGRLVGKVGHGYTNDARGRAIRDAFHLPEGTCTLCGGLTSEYDRLARLVAARLEPWEFDTFVVGSRIDREVAAREEALWSELGASHPEPLRAEVNREVGKRVEALRGTPADRDHPDVVAILDPAFDHVDVEVNPLYLAGRYRKLVRGIPQTRWPCRRCQGKGCSRCGGTGKMYPTSVEEVIAAPVVARTGGSGHALHGMGREDVDARMLGRGRPFVLEVKVPRRRHVDLAAAAAEVNESGLVEVGPLERTTAAHIVRIKEDRAEKTYRVALRLSPPVDEGKIKDGLAFLRGHTIAQRTPSRVAHRRADTIRHRRLHSAELTRLEGDLGEVLLTTDAGTYVKELIHGDSGRTKPSLAECLGVACEVLELDVLEIHDGA